MKSTIFSGGVATSGAEPDAIIRRVNAALRENRIDEAVREAEQGLARGIEHPLLLNLAAFRLQGLGRVAEALALLDRAWTLAPGDAFIGCGLGSCYAQQGRHPAALVAYEAVLARHRRHAPAHQGRGLALAAAGRDAEAREAFLKAASLAPDFADPLAALAMDAARRDLPAAARDYAERALALDADEPTAHQTLAWLDVRAGRFDAAVQRLQGRLARGRLAAPHRGALESLHAEALEGLGRYEAGMQAYLRAHAAVWSVRGPAIAASGVETGTQLCRRLNAYFQSADPSAWTPAAGGDGLGAGEGPAAHVFLMGFVRSGTTLLEQVLASHPRVTAVEEAPFLRRLGQAFVHSNAGLDRLAALDAPDAEALRAQYWRDVRAGGAEVAGRVFVDKNPLDIVWAPLVAKLFPSARFILARRDPRDVVVSALRHRFEVSAMTCAFTGLERTAEFYAEVMALTELYRERLGLTVHVHRHEDLIADFDGEVAAIRRFLGLEPAEVMADFVETAKRRDIRTPSAEQVRQPLSSAGMGRWRRYGETVAPMLPILEPWVEAFGYAP